jgi:hypothetical protein
MVKNINARIAAEASWACTHDRAARTRPAREAFLKRFEKEVDQDETLPAEERRQRAEHAKRAHMLKLAKRSAAARKAKRPTSKARYQRLSLRLLIVPEHAQEARVQGLIRSFLVEFVMLCAD